MKNLKLESIKDFSSHSIEKKQLRLITGGDYTVSTGGGSKTVGQGTPFESTISYSSDTEIRNDSSGALEQTTWHQSGTSSGP